MGLCANAVQVENRSKLFAFIVLTCLTYSVVRILTLPQKAPGTPGARGIKFQSLTEHIDTETPTGRAMWQMLGIRGSSHIQPKTSVKIRAVPGRRHVACELIRRRELRLWQTTTHFRAFERLCRA
jgi:hypothetical protein